MTADTLSCWLDHAGRFPLLTNEQVIHLSKLISGSQAGTVSTKVGERAINRLIECNLRLVAKVWRSQFAYVRASEARVVDLLQEGAIGLRRAAEKFDPTRGFTFATYAIPWIRKEMSAYLRDRDRNIRISADCFAVVNTAKKMISQEEALTGRRPSVAEIAAKVKKPESTVEFFLERYLITSNSSLNRTISQKDGDVGQVMDIVEGRPDYCFESDARAEKLNRIIEILMEAADLNPCERDLVIGRNCHGDMPRSFADIAREHNVEAPWARNQYLRCMKRLEKAAVSSGMSMTRILDKV